MYSVEEALAPTIEVRLGMSRVAVTFIDHMWNAETYVASNGRHLPDDDTRSLNTNAWLPPARDRPRAVVHT